ncbi:MAG TPA: hypothetical protein VEU31_07285 [Candidatus Acidoferrales bacterium]|nr:hypothetical protein [Candidatus Acidoferrales bacterium]
MIKLGVIITAATLAVLTAEFLSRRTRPFPAYGWTGLLALVCAEWLMFRGVQPVATYFTPIAWTAYILIADAALFAMRGRSFLRGAPMDLGRMALLSIPLWLIFEAYNLRLVNWTYVGLPSNPLARWFGYAWSFATITPGILLTAELVESFGWFSRPRTPLCFSPGAERTFVFVGACLLVVPLVLPRWIASYLFALVWVGFILLLDPLLKKRGAPSLLGDLAQGQIARLCSLLASGWVCGWLWEFWNFWAPAKWHYIFPILQGWKIFEMPAVGYLGFLPFAVECFLLYVFAAAWLGWLPSATHKRRTAAVTEAGDSCA